MTFAFSATPPSFVTLQDVNNSSGKVQVSGATKTDHDSYPLTLTATVDAVSVSALFTVQIKDPCSYAVFETDPTPIVNMTVDILNPTGLNQAVTIYTDV